MTCKKGENIVGQFYMTTNHSSRGMDVEISVDFQVVFFCNV